MASVIRPSGVDGGEAARRPGLGGHDDGEGRRAGRRRRARWRRCCSYGLRVAELALEQQVPAAQDDDREDGGDPERPAAGSCDRAGARRARSAVGKATAAAGVAAGAWRRCRGRPPACRVRGAPRGRRRAAAMIRAFSPAGGSTTGDGRGERRQDAAELRRSRRAASAHVARCARTAAASAGVEGAEDEGAREVADLVAGQPRAARSVMPDSAAVDRSLRLVRQRAAHRQQPEAHPALDGAERRRRPFRDLLLGQAAEVGELDRLALDVGQRPRARRGPPRASRSADDLGPDVGQRQRRRRRRPRARAARWSAGAAGRRRSRGGGRSRAARSSRCRGPRRSAPALRHAPRNASWTTSSASEASVVMR